MTRNTNAQAEHEAPIWDRFKYGAVAGKLLQSEDSSEYTVGALDNLVSDLELSEDAQGFVKGAYASEDGIKTAVSIYAGKHEEEKGNLTPNEFINNYSNVLDGLSEDEITTIRAVFNNTENIGAIRKKFVKAQRIVNDAKEFSNDPLMDAETIAAARATVKKYSGLFKSIGVIENYGLYEKLRPNAVEATRKDKLKGLVKILSE